MQTKEHLNVTKMYRAQNSRDRRNSAQEKVSIGAGNYSRKIHANHSQLPTVSPIAPRQEALTTKCHPPGWGTETMTTWWQSGQKVSSSPFPIGQKAVSPELQLLFQCHSHSNFTCLCSL